MSGGRTSRTGQTGLTGQEGLTSGGGYVTAKQWMPWSVWCAI